MYMIVGPYEWLTNLKLPQTAATIEVESNFAATVILDPLPLSHRGDLARSSRL